MSERPFFTVGVPTFDRANSYLPVTLGALLRQSFRDFDLLVSDNASSDDTAAVVRGLADSRVRYVRRAERMPPGEHFAAIAREARGRYFVLNQDDDLLHLDFLRRAHEALAIDPKVVIYAAPIWRETPNRGYMSRALRPREGYSDENVIADRPYRIDGTYAAAKLFDTVLHFVHPAIAMDAERLAETGGYDSGARYSVDLVTQARMLIGRQLAYDPRPGGIFRVHPANVSRTMKRPERKAFYRRTYEALIGAFEGSGADWRAPLGDYLATLGSDEILESVREWFYYRAPRELQVLGMDCLARSWSGSRLALYRKCASRLGLRNLVRHASSRFGF